MCCSLPIPPAFTYCITAGHHNMHNLAQILKHSSVISTVKKKSHLKFFRRSKQVKGFRRKRNKICGVYTSVLSLSHQDSPTAQFETRLKCLCKDMLSIVKAQRPRRMKIRMTKYEQWSITLFWQCALEYEIFLRSKNSHWCGQILTR